MLWRSDGGAVITTARDGNVRCRFSADAAGVTQPDDALMTSFESSRCFLAARVKRSSFGTCVLNIVRSLVDKTENYSDGFIHLGTQPPQ